MVDGTRCIPDPTNYELLQCQDESGEFSVAVVDSDAGSVSSALPHKKDFYKKDPLPLNPAKVAFKPANLFAVEYWAELSQDMLRDYAENLKQVATVLEKQAPVGEIPRGGVFSPSLIPVRDVPVGELPFKASMTPANLGELTTLFEQEVFRPLSDGPMLIQRIGSFPGFQDPSIAINLLEAGLDPTFNQKTWDPDKKPDFMIVTHDIDTVLERLGDKLGWTADKLAMNKDLAKQGMVYYNLRLGPYFDFKVGFIKASLWREGYSYFDMRASMLPGDYTFQHLPETNALETKPESGASSVDSNGPLSLAEFLAVWQHRSADYLGRTAELHALIHPEFSAKTLVEWRYQDQFRLYEAYRVNDWPKWKKQMGRYEKELAIIFAPKWKLYLQSHPHSFSVFDAEGREIQADDITEQNFLSLRFRSQKTFMDRSVDAWIRLEEFERMNGEHFRQTRIGGKSSKSGGGNNAAYVLRKVAQLLGSPQVEVPQYAAKASFPNGVNPTLHDPKGRLVARMGEVAYLFDGMAERQNLQGKDSLLLWELILDIGQQDQRYYAQDDTKSDASADLPHEMLSSKAQAKIPPQDMETFIKRLEAALSKKLAAKEAKDAKQGVAKVAVSSGNVDSLQGQRAFLMAFDLAYNLGKSEVAGLGPEVFRAHFPHYFQMLNQAIAETEASFQQLKQEQGSSAYRETLREFILTYLKNAKQSLTDLYVLRVGESPPLYALTGEAKKYPHSLVSPKNDEAVAMSAVFHIEYYAAIMEKYGIPPEYMPRAIAQASGSWISQQLDKVSENRVGPLELESWLATETGQIFLGDIRHHDSIRNRWAQRGPGFALGLGTVLASNYSAQELGIDCTIYSHECFAASAGLAHFAGHAANSWNSVAVEGYSYGFARTRVVAGANAPALQWLYYGSDNRSQLFRQHFRYHAGLNRSMWGLPFAGARAVVNLPWTMRNQLAMSNIAGELSKVLIEDPHSPWRPLAHFGGFVAWDAWAISTRSGVPSLAQNRYWRGLAGASGAGFAANLGYGLGRRILWGNLEARYRNMLSHATYDQAEVTGDVGYGVWAVHALAPDLAAGSFSHHWTGESTQARKKIEISWNQLADGVERQALDYLRWKILWADQDKNDFYSQADWTKFEKKGVASASPGLPVDDLLEDFENDEFYASWSQGDEIQRVAMVQQRFSRLGLTEVQAVQTVREAYGKIAVKNFLGGISIHPRLNEKWDGIFDAQGRVLPNKKQTLLNRLLPNLSEADIMLARRVHLLFQILVLQENQGDAKRLESLKQKAQDLRLMTGDSFVPGVESMAAQEIFEKWKQVRAEAKPEEEVANILPRNLPPTKPDLMR